MALRWENPKATPWAVLGVAKADWDTALGALMNFAISNPAMEFFTRGDLEGIHPIYSNRRVLIAACEAAGFPAVDRD